MKHLKHPATLIAALALFVALGGGATASVLMSGSQIKNHSIAAKKLTRHAVKSLRGRRGPRGPVGPQGPAGSGGSALAYAHITAKGALDASHSSGVTASNFKHNGAGRYCFSGLSFTPHNVVATIDAAGAGTKLPGPIAHVALGTSSFCPTGSQVAVITESSNALANFGVYVLFN